MQILLSGIWRCPTDCIVCFWFGITSFKVKPAKFTPLSWMPMGRMNLKIQIRNSSRINKKVEFCKFELHKFYMILDRFSCLDMGALYLSDSGLSFKIFLAYFSVGKMWIFIVFTYKCGFIGDDYFILKKIPQNISTGTQEELQAIVFIHNIFWGIPNFNLWFICYWRERLIVAVSICLSL